MKLVLAILGLWFLSASGALAQDALTAQPLSVSVRGDEVEATRLPAYVPDVPIAVTVRVGPQHIDAISVAALGPAGETVSLPLARSSDGTFTGWLALREEGTWRLSLTSRAGSLSTNTTPVELDVHAPQPSNSGLIGLLVGGGIFVVVGGGGFWLLQRGRSKSRLNRHQTAA